VQQSAHRRREPRLARCSSSTPTCSTDVTSIDHQALYDRVMSSVTQVAFQLDDQSLATLDELAKASAQSRAEVLRSAVREFLNRRREEQIDAQIAAAYADLPAGAEQDASAAASRAGLEAADLDW
jgi:predicted transcriptional regulator